MFIYTLFKLPFQFRVATTAGTAVMLYAFYSEGPRSKLGPGSGCTDRGFSCFHLVPEFTFREIT